MLSYQACLELHSCCLEDAGIYKIQVTNKEGSVTSSASLLVTDKSAVISRCTEGFDTIPSVLYRGGIDRLKAYHSENDLRNVGKRSFRNADSAPSECGSAPGSGTITLRRPFSPRQYYERRHKDQRSTVVSELGTLSVCDSGTCKATDFDQSFSSASSLSSMSTASPSRLSRSYESEDRFARYDSLSRSLNSADQRKLNSIKIASSEDGLNNGIFKGRCNPAYAESEMSRIRPLDEQSVSALSDQTLNSLNGPDLLESSHRQFTSTNRCPPGILSSLPEQDNVVNIGEQLTLACVVDGHPRPKVVWLKDAEHLSESTQIWSESEQISTSNSHAWKHTLLFKSFAESDAGSYTLTAYNVLGDVSTKTRVRIRNEFES